MIMKFNIKTFSYVTLTLFSLQAFAEDTIKISVKTKEATASALGYTVEGKDHGGPGKSYTGKGPKNKKYSFGYRKRAKGTNISCGDLTLTKDSTVNLITKGKSCKSVLGK